MPDHPLPDGEYLVKDGKLYRLVEAPETVFIPTVWVGEPVPDAPVFTVTNVPDDAEPIWIQATAEYS